VNITRGARQENQFVLMIRSGDNDLHRSSLTRTPLHGDIVCATKRPQFSPIIDRRDARVFFNLNLGQGQLSTQRSGKERSRMLRSSPNMTDSLRFFLYWRKTQKGCCRTFIIKSRSMQSGRLADGCICRRLVACIYSTIYHLIRDDGQASTLLRTWLTMSGVCLIRLGHMPRCHCAKRSPQNIWKWRG
jgi:hypothetical protein